MLAAYTSKARLAVTILVTCCSFFVAGASFAQNATPTPSPQAQGTTQSSLEDPVASLEAYIKNTDGSKTLADSPGPGHNAWMMTASALVLFMTLPGLALFYGGLVRRKNVLSVMAQCLGCAGLVTVLWWVIGYSLVFGKGGALGGLLGSAQFAFLKGVDAAPNGDYSYWVSQNIFSMYQLMF